jgi:phage protein D
MKRLALTAVFLSSLWPAAHAQAPIERVKMTDNDLTCQQAYNEIGQMDGVMARSRQPVAAAGVQADPNAANNAMAGAVAGAVAQTAMANAAARGGFGFGGFGGGGGSVGGLFGSLVQQAATQGAQQAAADQAAAAATAQQNALLAQQAQGRKDHLTSLFLSKGCKMSEIVR